MLSGALRVAAVAVLLLAGMPTTQAQPTKLPRIGVLGTVPLSNPGAAHIWAGFFEGMQQLGYVEGSNLVIERRYGDGRPERLAALSAELVRLKVDVIVAAAYAASTAKDATSTIPIVMTNNGDPVGNRLVASLARPGGNVTGMSTLALDLTGKQLQLLKDALPALSHVSVLSNPTNPVHRSSLRQAENAAQAMKVRLQVLEVRVPAEFDAAFSAAAKEPEGAILMVGDPLFTGERMRIVELATRHRLPLMTNQSEFPEAGALLSYGTDQRDSFRRAAAYVDRILKGVRPSDLPVEQATKFELIVNLKTAKSLGVTMSPNVLSRADRVIE